MADSGRLVWIDMEMTGLDPAQHVTLEIATLITDADLEVLAEGPVIAVARSDEEMARIDDWSLRTHTAPACWSGWRRRRPAWRRRSG